MQLERKSVEWAIEAIAKNSDSDLFPPTPEFGALVATSTRLVDELTQCELKDLPPGPSRRFLVPKDEISYRQATQLDPQDSLILTALIHQFGLQIEERRLSDRQVFSYRFQPSATDLFIEQPDWNRFWQRAIDLAGEASTVLYCDITDFYNQISHHTLENQLIAAELPNQAIKWIIGLLESTTAGVSRGVPIGPHPVHLLAEASLIPVDNALRDHGLTFVRFVDDIVVVCDGDEDARAALGAIAHTLDRQQRLTLQRHKTRIFEKADFIQFAYSMLEDQPISESEEELLKIVQKYAKGNPYRTVWFSEIAEEDWLQITERAITAIIDQYLSAKWVSYTRLGWFYRRLAQIGHPGALAATLARFDELIPCLPSVVGYIASLQTVEDAQWLDVGDRLLELLDTAPFRQQEYFEVVLLGLFGRNKPLNHFQKVGRRWPGSSPAARRQLLLAATRNNAVDWLRNLKEDFPSMDTGQQLAFVYAMSTFPADERKYFLSRNVLDTARPLMKAVARTSR